MTNYYDQLPDNRTFRRHFYIIAGIEGDIVLQYICCVILFHRQIKICLLGTFTKLLLCSV